MLRLFRGAEIYCGGLNNRSTRSYCVANKTYESLEDEYRHCYELDG